MYSEYVGKVMVSVFFWLFFFVLKIVIVGLKRSGGIDFLFCCDSKDGTVYAQSVRGERKATGNLFLAFLFGDTKGKILVGISTVLFWDVLFGTRLATGLLCF